MINKYIKTGSHDSYCKLCLEENSKNREEYYLNKNNMKGQLDNQKCFSMFCNGEYIYICKKHISKINDFLKDCDNNETTI